MKLKEIMGTHFQMDPLQSTSDLIYIIDSLDTNIGNLISSSFLDARTVI